MHWLSLSLVAALTFVSPGPVDGAPPAAPPAIPGLDPFLDAVPRVRPTDVRAATLLREGMRRSPAFGALVTGLDGGDVIAYVEIRPGMNDRLAGSLTWVASTGGFRYVRISLNPGFPTTALIASAGHELHHVGEVLAHRWVTDARTLRALYERIGDAVGPAHLGMVDTAGARDAGTRIRRELRDIRPARVAMARTISPAEWYQWYQPQRKQVSRK